MDQFWAIPDPASPEGRHRNFGIEPRHRHNCHPRRAWFLTRLAFLAIVCLSLLVLSFGVAHAHASERAFVLLLPTGYYLFGGTLAVAGTFLALRYVQPEKISKLFQMRLVLLRAPAVNPLWLSLPTLVASAMLLVAGWAGPRDPMENALSTAFWTLGWIGLTLAHALFGNLWALINPLHGADWLIGKGLSGVHWLCLQFAGRLPLSSSVSIKQILDTKLVPSLSYPDWLGYWPAIAGFFCFAWFELVFPAPEDPDVLANAILCYVVANLVAMRIFGSRAWLKRGEAFSVFFRLVAGLSPIDVTREAASAERTRISLVMPGGTLIQKTPRRLDFTLFVLLALASVSFDGLSKTFWWLSLAGANPLEFPGRSAMVAWNSLGLAAMFGVLGLFYFAAELIGHRISRLATPGWPYGAVVSLVPISLSFHGAHYLTTFLVNVQYTLVSLSDPLDRGWNLLGHSGHHVTTSFLYNRADVTLIWNAQASAIVLGHILAVVMAQALSRPPAQSASVNWAGQSPLAILMIVYTLFGLWLLSTPVAG